MMYATACVTLNWKQNYMNIFFWIQRRNEFGKVSCLCPGEKFEYGETIRIKRAECELSGVNCTVVSLILHISEHTRTHTRTHPCTYIPSWLIFVHHEKCHKLSASVCKSLAHHVCTCSEVPLTVHLGGNFHWFGWQLFQPDNTYN